MAAPPISSASGSQIVSCLLSTQTILDAQSLAARYDVPLAHVLRSAVALLSSIYGYSGVVTQAIATIDQTLWPLARLDIGQVKVLSIEIDRSRQFLDLARSVSESSSSNDILEGAYRVRSPSLPTEKPQGQHPAVDALVCLYDFPERACAGLLEPHFASQWEDILYQLNCNFGICLPASPSAVEAVIIHRSTASSEISAMGLAATLAKILSSVVAQPNCELGEIDCLGESDEALIRRQNEHVAQPQLACLHNIISSQAARRPKAPAISATDGDLRYEELDRLSSRLAVHLVKRGVQRGGVVPLCFEKSKYMVISMLAVFKAGAACTMLESSLPTERLQNMIQQVSAALVLVSSSQKSRFKNLTVAVEINQSFFDQEDESEDIILPQSYPSDAAMILFTSGSTGSPKGILHEHVTILTGLHTLARRLKLDGSVRICQFAAYSFDLSMIEILLPLIVGGCVCIPSEESRINNLANTMEEMGVTFAMLTPSSIKLLRPDGVPSMKMIMVGGEPITGELIRVWEHHVTLINAWGASECGICTCTIVNHSLPTSIGSCIEAAAWIVDPQNMRRLLPVGAVGELIIEGPQVARGYLGEPEKSLASFIESPPWLHRAPQGRLYRTGDLLRHMRDGSFEYCGRKDSQVKIRGCRIELGEVEYYITANNLVRTAMVSVPKQGIYHGKLVAIVQLNDALEHTKQFMENGDPVVLTLDDEGRSCDWVKTITTDLEGKLPSQSVPEKWIVVVRLPITASDKVDRKKMNDWLAAQTALPQIPEAETDAECSPGPGLREIKRMVARVIVQEGDSFDQEMLRSDSHLKAYGINSLSVVALSGAIQESFKACIPIKVLLDSSLTIAGLADLIRRAASNGNGYGLSLPHGDLNCRPASCIALKDFHDIESELLGSVGVPVGRRVFLTGATGYVGSHILHSLLTHPHVGTVCALVRAPTQNHALSKIVAAATVGRWWSEALLPKLEVWLGDLGQSNLGLSAEHLSRLKSGRDSSGAIDAIVHNGAIVHWLADYEELRPANVCSTVQLLEIARLSASISNFVYVSSDPEMNFDATVWEKEKLALHLSRLSGYRQTKAVSEMLVRSMESAFASASIRLRFSLIKPGFIVGSDEKGIVNADDFLWRLSASVVRLKAYDSSEATGWIYISSVDVISNRVLDALFSECAKVKEDAVIADGIKIERFWEMLGNVSGCPLQPLPHDEWLAHLRQDVFRTGNRHPMWPLLHLLENENLTLRATVTPSATGHCEPADATHAVMKGLTYLKNSGLLTENIAWLGEEAYGQTFQRRR